MQWILFSMFVDSSAFVLCFKVQKKHERVLSKECQICWPAVCTKVVSPLSPNVGLVTMPHVAVTPDLVPVLAPECRDNTECPPHTACINRKCLNPCAVTDPCATNAFCRVDNHEPVCTCPSGYIGDPRVQCIKPERKSCRFFSVFRESFILKICA